MCWSPDALIFYSGDLAGLECSILAYFSHIPFTLPLGNQWLGRMVSRSISTIHPKIRLGCSQHMYLDLRFMTQKKKKKCLKHFCHSENVVRLLFLLISQHSLEGSGKTELFVQDTINHMRPFGEWDIEQSEVRINLTGRSVWRVVTYFSIRE